MSVKAQGPADVDRSTEHKGSSVGTPGLSALDEEREASLADEGGASGAVVESQDVRTLRRLASDLPVGHLGILVSWGCLAVRVAGREVWRTPQNHVMTATGGRLCVVAESLARPRSTTQPQVD